jgi:aspartyl/asparaginyl-tRNA synthetase/glutathione S-transferase
VYGHIPLIRQIKNNDDDMTKHDTLSSPPHMKGRTLTLKQSIDHQMCSITTVNASLRWLASSTAISSTHLLGGYHPLDQSVVDSWLYFGWSSLDVPMDAWVLSSSGSGTTTTTRTTNQEQISHDFHQAIQILDTNLLYRTYIAGSHHVSIADIRCIGTLWYAAQHQLWKPDDSHVNDYLYGNVKRWYHTMVNQDWFQQSIQLLSTLDVTIPIVVSSSASTMSSKSNHPYNGNLFNGVPPPVMNHKYRRQRIRMKEIFGNDGGKCYIGQTIAVAGWSRTVRKASSKLIFVELNDGSTGQSLQCVLDIQTTDGFDECKLNGGTGSSFQFIGEVVSSVGAEQVIDLKVTRATLLGAVYGGNAEGTVIGGMLYPLSKKEHTLEHMRDVAHLRPRGQIHAAAMRIRHAMAYATHTFFHNHGFLYIHTPIITGADCEGAGEQFAITTMFGADHLQPHVNIPIHPTPTTLHVEGGDGSDQVTMTTADGSVEVVEEKKISKNEMKRLAKQKAKAEKATGHGTDVALPHEEVHDIVVPGAIDYTKDFFGQRVNLTVSGQLNVETHACALSDVYTFGPTFRAEESRTYRHLSEFWMIEPEIAFGTLQDDIDLAEDYLKYCVQYALTNCTADLEFFEQNPHGEQGLRQRLNNVLQNEFKVRFFVMIYIFISFFVLGNDESYCTLGISRKI